MGYYSSIYCCVCVQSSTFIYGAVPVLYIISMCYRFSYFLVCFLTFLWKGYCSVQKSYSTVRVFAQNSNKGRTVGKQTKNKMLSICDTLSVGKPKLVFRRFSDVSTWSLSKLQIRFRSKFCSFFPLWLLWVIRRYYDSLR